MNSAAPELKKQRDKKKTRASLERALLKIKDGDSRMSVARVAQEAGVDASLIHHVYPDLAEEIRALRGRSTSQQQIKKNDQLIAAKNVIHQLKREIDCLKRDVSRLASINLRLTAESVELSSRRRANELALLDK